MENNEIMTNVDYEETTDITPVDEESGGAEFWMVVGAAAVGGVALYEGGKALLNKVLKPAAAKVWAKLNPVKGVVVEHVEVEVVEDKSKNTPKK